MKTTPHILLEGPTFRIVAVTDTLQAIVCTLCGRTSTNVGDVANLYCGRCKLFHGAVAEARRLLSAESAHECREWVTGNGICAVCGRNVR